MILQGHVGKLVTGHVENGDVIMTNIEEILIRAYTHNIHAEVMELAATLLQTPEYKFYPVLAYEHAYIQIYETVKK